MNEQSKQEKVQIVKWKRVFQMNFFNRGFVVHLKRFALSKIIHLKIFKSIFSTQIFNFTKE